MHFDMGFGWPKLQPAVVPRCPLLSYALAMLGSVRAKAQGFSGWEDHSSQSRNMNLKFNDCVSARRQVAEATMEAKPARTWDFVTNLNHTLISLLFGSVIKHYRNRCI